MTDSRRTAFVAVARFPYEEPYHTQLRIAASNGEYSGRLDLYCGVNELLEISNALSRFPSKVPDEYYYEYGSEDPAVRFYRYFKLRAYTTDLRGQCALQFTMNLNQSEPTEGRCCFSFQVEPAALQRLAHLFKELHEAPTGEFEWTLASEEFVRRPDMFGHST